MCIIENIALKQICYEQRLFNMKRSTRKNFRTHENDYYAKFYMTIKKKYKRMKLSMSKSIFSHMRVTIMRVPSDK